MDAEFKNIKQRLQTNDKICVEIKEHPTGRPIIPISDRIDHKKMIKQSGGLEAWFADLQTQGITKIQIQLHKKQGNACIREGLAYNCELGGGEAKKETMETPKQVHPQTPATMQPYGLGMPGLSMPDMINLNVDSRMLQMTKQELEVEKAKTVRLEKENQTLEEELRTLKSGAATKEFWGNMFKEAAPALQGIVSAFATPGLGAPAAPQAAPNLPEGLKGDLIKVIMNAQGLSDDQLMLTYQVLRALANNRSNFKEELDQLLQQEKPMNNGATHTS